MAVDRRLRLIAPKDISPNPENPRLIFRQAEMESLMLSIDKHGIQVPLTVYRDGNGFKLIDGERRWRCARKLNLRTVPAIVQEKPSELANLILMYNIHALREQWDYFTIASKLERVIVLFANEHDGEAPGEVVLSELTGLTRGAIRRCQLIIDLPQRFKQMLLAELEKPKVQQRLSEDFFIEMEKSLKAVTRRLPEYSDKIDSIRDTLVAKFKNKTISAVTDFRQLSKIATAIKGLGVSHKRAKNAIDKVFNSRSKTGIKEAYSETVEFDYTERRATKQIESLYEFVDSIYEDGRGEDLDDDLFEKLTRLNTLLTKFIEAYDE